MSLAAAAKHFGKEIIRAGFTPRLYASSEAEADAICQLRHYFATALNSDESASDVWNANIEELRRRVLEEDPRRFLQWPVITRSMTCHYARFVYRELRHLRRRDDFCARWKDAIREDVIGNGVRYPMYPKSSGTRIHHAYHLARFEEVTQRRISDLDCIIEFGGGYGDMCRVAHNLGFEGKYIIFDLAPFSELQKFYLRSLLLPVLEPSDIIDHNKGICCLSDNNLIHDLCIKHFGQSSEANRLFIGTWSLSETPLDIREKCRPWITQCNQFLIAYQNAFEGINNLKYFQEFASGIRGIRWKKETIDHISGNAYMFGGSNQIE